MANKLTRLNCSLLINECTVLIISFGRGFRIYLVGIYLTIRGKFPSMRKHSESQEGRNIQSQLCEVKLGLNKFQHDKGHQIIKIMATKIYYYFPHHSCNIAKTLFDEVILSLFICVKPILSLPFFQRRWYLIIWQGYKIHFV